MTTAKTIGAGVLLACLAVACASIRPARRPSTSTVLPSETIVARLAEADALAARGCYLCLREAAGRYYNLIQIADTPDVLRHALDNDLMMAIREVEMRLPDSGARERARGIAVRLPPSPSVRLKPDTTEDADANYGDYFEALDFISNPVIFGGSIT